MTPLTFISYTYSDNDFVQWLKVELLKHKVNFWLDQHEIKYGDNIIQKISEALQKCNSILFVSSKNSINSNWVGIEYSAALLHSSNKSTKIIAIKIDDTEIPKFYKNQLIIDFYKDRNSALDYLIREIKLTPVGIFQKPDWKKLNGRIFEDLIYELLIKQNLEVIRTAASFDSGIDLVAITKNAFGSEDKIVIQCKFYSNNKRNVGIAVLRELYGAFLIEKANKVLLVTNSQLTNTARDFISTFDNIIVWDEELLLKQLYSYHDLLEKYFSIKHIEKYEEIKPIDKELEQTLNLIKELDNCPEGIEGWKEYEDVCIKILKKLFIPPLEEPKIQSRREPPVDIRDAIFPNRSKEEGWEFIRNEYDAKYILFEFKNYSKDGSEIDKQVVMQTSDYLKKTIGRFGIVCSKKLPNTSGIQKRKDIFIEHNKLIIFLSNEHLKEMLLRKYKKLDPLTVIFDLIDEFNLTF